MPEITLSQALNVALRHHQAGDLAKADLIYRQILTRDPNHADALHLLGVIAHQTGRHEVAVELIGRAIVFAPNKAAYHYNLGTAYQAQGLHYEAVGCFQRALALKPAYAEAHNNLGTIFYGKGQLDDAIASYNQALAIKPDYADAHYNLGGALRDQGLFEEALVHFKRSAELNPNSADTHYHLGVMLRDRGALDEARFHFEQAVALKPEHADAHANLGAILQRKGLLDQAIACYNRVLALRPSDYEARHNLGCVLVAKARYDEAMVCFNVELALKPLRQPHSNDRDPDRRLRIGYVSPDFRDHVIGRNLLPLFRCHDHERFEIFCYSNVRFEDTLTQQFRGFADHWRGIVDQSDDEVAQIIRADRIDILVDLALHLTDNRLLVFARKPAPVQVTFAGYPGTTGLNAIDYRLTDPYLDPPGMNDQFYSEESIRLPDTFWCYDPLEREIEINALPAKSAGYVTFGSLNNFSKINEQSLGHWAQIMQRVPGSRLLLSAPEGSHRHRMVELLRQGGIDSERIEFADLCPRRDYLKLYHRIDVGLDTLPYNGHTTSLDSFWMGVPVVTLVGKTVVGRAGLSQLTNLGCPELIAHNPEEFVQTAAGLACDLPRLADLRSTLRQRMEGSPLMDAPRFTCGIEDAYRTIWRKLGAMTAG